jgi:hypothetical protein
MSFFLVRSLIPIVSIPAIQLISYTSVFSKERALGEPGCGDSKGVYPQKLALITGIWAGLGARTFFGAGGLSDLQMKYISVLIWLGGLARL